MHRSISSDASLPVVGIPGYWHESDAILGRHATAVPDSYIRAVSKVDALPLVIPVISNNTVLDQFLRGLDGLLLIGGPDLDPVHYNQEAHPGLRKVTPPRDKLELLVTRWALEDALPIMAICRGVQVLNVAMGGTLWQDIALQLPRASKHDYHPDHPVDYLAHSVELLPGTRLVDAIGDAALQVNSLHHQAIDELGPGLRPVAYSPDGIIEAVEGTGADWVMGVQWHPEWMVEEDPRMVALFKAFRDACIQRRQAILRKA